MLELCRVVTDFDNVKFSNNSIDLENVNIIKGVTHERIDRQIGGAIRFE